MVDFDSRKLFVGGISRGTTEIDLKDYFSRYGDVSFSTIAKDRMTGIPRGFGFVTFTDASSSDRALADHHEILGKTVEVKRAVPRVEQQQSPQIHGGTSISINGDSQFRAKKIFVGGLSANLTEEEFKGYFEKFGRITDVVVMHDTITNRPRGFGFITFDSEDVVEEILKKSFHELGGKFVEVKRAIPKDPINNGSNAQISRMRGREYDGYWQENYNYNFYLSHYLMSSYGYNGVYNAGYHMAGYGFTGFGMSMALPYVSAPGYHRNCVFDAESVSANDGIGDNWVNGKSSCVDGS